MTLRCRKGDMAICIKTYHANHVGAIVEIGEFVGAYWQDGKIYDNCWMISYRGIENIALMPDAWLLPIRPGDLKETDEMERELTV